MDKPLQTTPKSKLHGRKIMICVWRDRRGMKNQWNWKCVQTCPEKCPTLVNKKLFFLWKRKAEFQCYSCYIKKNLVCSAQPAIFTWSHINQLSFSNAEKKKWRRKFPLMKISYKTSSKTFTHENLRNLSQKLSSSCWITGNTSLQIMVNL